MIAETAWRSIPRQFTTVRDILLKTLSPGTEQAGYRCRAQLRVCYIDFILGSHLI